MTNDAPPPPPPTPMAPPSSQPQPKKASHRKRNIVLGAVGVFVLLGVIGSLSKPTGSPESSTRPTAIAEAPSAQGETLGPPAPSSTATSSIATATPVPPTPVPATAAPSVDDAWTVSGWADRFRAYGFAEPTNSPLNDGTPRQLMHRESDSASTEAIGDPQSLKTVSLLAPVTVSNGDEMGQLVGAFLNTYAPGAHEEVVSKIKTDDDYTVPFEGGTVHVQSLVVSDGAVLTVSVDRG